MSIDLMSPKIEERFLQPAGWRWHTFERNKRKIRFGTISPKDSIPDAVVVCLGGVREFSEKYFELARWCNTQNLAFWTFDWVGQGQSMRYLPNPQKRHSHNFNEDIDDLHYFIMEYIKHSSVHPDKGRIPLTMIAHSMGANIGLRYLQKYPALFECAAFTAPMIGIKAFQKLPQKLALCAASLCKTILSHHYVPNGNDWQKRTEHAHLTSDPIRKTVQDQWSEANPALQCGDVTFGWLYNAQKSCIELQNIKTYGQINTPCLFGISGHEDLVDNTIARKVIAEMKNTKTIEYPDSGHEILMETDVIRTDFLNNFYTLIKENIIDRPETLKPF